MAFKNLNIRTKLTATFLLVGLVPLITSNLTSYFLMSNEVKHEAERIATIVGEKKASEIKNYFYSETSNVEDLADSPVVIQALEELAVPFSAQPDPNSELIKRYQKDLSEFYSKTFANAYKEKNGKAISVEDTLSKLDPLTVVAQHEFIVSNPNELGKKDLLDASDRNSPYSQIHSKYHKYLRGILTRHALYDLFLVTTDGRVVYSVFKEVDFATSLRKGPWANTNLAKGFEQSLKTPKGKVFIADFETYTPSYDAPASFIAAPVYKDDQLLGSIIIQLPLDKFNAVVSAREGLGKNGETLLLGSDLRLRADTFRNKSTHNLVTSFAPDSKLKFETEAIKKAQAGETGTIENVSYDGVSTLSHFGQIKIKNLTWYIVTELDEAEVFASLKTLTWSIAIILLVGTPLIICIGMLVSNQIAKNLRQIASVLHASSREVSAASAQSASSSTELSEAATEQAASLQETMASIEEISAMVNQNAESATKATTAVDANQKSSEEGSRSVDEMLRSIQEIKQTNDDILEQMNASNREFGEIVKIISEIGTKTNVINEIVFQTKLLSFNASVEAARAGEHGKGFAVVAEEVGNLAQMSGNAAKEITNMLSDSIRKVNEIVERTRSKVDDLVEIGKDKIAMGQSTAQNCREALNKITENARSVAAMINEISHASKEQAQGVQEINKAISQLDQVTQQNSAVAQQSSTQAEQLNTEATALFEAVSKLVIFVEGQSQRKSHSEAESVTTSENSVVPMKRSHSSGETPKHGSHHNSAQSQKRVAGSDVVPSSQDPNFEEF